MESFKIKPNICTVFKKSNNIRLLTRQPKYSPDSVCPVYLSLAVSSAVYLQR